MPRISALPSLTTVDGADELPVVDVSASTTKKATKADYLKDAATYLTAGSIPTGAYEDESVTDDKIDFTTFQAPVSTTGSNATVTNGNTAVTMNYPFVEKYWYMIIASFQRADGANASVWQLNIRANTGTSGVLGGSARTEAITQNGRTLIAVRQAPSTATQAVDVYCSQLSGTGGLEVEVPTITVIPMPYKAP